MVLLGISLVLASLGYVLFIHQARPWQFLNDLFRRQVERVPASRRDETNGESKDRRDSNVKGYINGSCNTTMDVEPNLQFPQLQASNPDAKSQSLPRSSTSLDVQLMPPPSRPPRAPPQPAAARQNALPLNVPRGPVPNRGPPSRLSASGSLVPPSATSSLPTGMAIPGQPRRKVVLEPGHSPLDWAHLTRTKADLSGVDGLRRITHSQLAEQNGRKGRPAWSAYQGKVYNITPYLPFHPGGRGELMRAAAKDGGPLFMEIHPWVNWDNMLGSCLVGFLVSEVDAPSSNIMEEMD